MSLNDARMRAASLSVILNALLTAAKLVIGFSSGSISVVSEGLHSLSDVAASLVTAFAVRIANEPPDEEHPFGHGKAEPLSAIAQAAFLVVAAGYILADAILRLIKGAAEPHFSEGLLIMAVTAASKAVAAVYVRKIARQSDSSALYAEAANHRVDVLTSAGVFIGLAAAQWTGWSLLDPLMALAVCAVILAEVWKMFRGALTELMDTRLPEEDEQWIRELLSSTPGILAFHKLKTRMSGGTPFIEAHVELEGEPRLSEIHRQLGAVKKQVRSRWPRAEVLLYPQPPRRLDMSPRRDAPERRRH